MFSINALTLAWQIYSQPPECAPAECPDAAPANTRAIAASLGAVGAAAAVL